VGDYVSDECTVLRGERFAVERKLHDVKRDLSARLALERYDEAKEIQALVIELECERDRITREIEREQTTLLRHLDELY
jgi:DNA transposition AAA+ family ATPase